ncbi:MAG: hypothetical protein ACREA0_01905, partial [bacterium]
YVFTDPPFGSNIFYSDMNLFQEAWLRSATDHDREAVMHTTGNEEGRRRRSVRRFTPRRLQRGLPSPEARPVHVGGVR